MNEEQNLQASRKKRGLKILSVKVQELVYQKQRTTYKDVANELIEQLKRSNEMKELTGLGEFSEREDNDEESDVDVKPTQKRGKDSGAKKSQLQKWEKNVRRRVYDALNVLYAAGVLKKDQKFVSCDNKAMTLTNSLKDFGKTQQNESAQSNPKL